MSTTESALNRSRPGDRRAEKPALVDGRARKLCRFGYLEVQCIEDHPNDEGNEGKRGSGGGEKEGELRSEGGDALQPHGRGTNGPARSAESETGSVRVRKLDPLSLRRRDRMQLVSALALHAARSRTPRGASFPRFGDFGSLAWPGPARQATTLARVSPFLGG